MDLHTHHHPPHYWPHRLGIWALLCVEGALVGLGAGLVIGAFRLVRDTAFPVLMKGLALWQSHWWIMPLWAAALVVLARVLAALVHAVPLISGSGIPQTELIIAGRLHISRMMWLRVLAAKFAGSSLSTLGGLSLGREGPCIQMGAAVAALVSALWERSFFVGHIHLAAGAAAGMAAAFGAPAAGMLFVFEEMKGHLTRGGLLTTLCAVTSAHLTARHLFGFERMFPFAGFAAPDLAQSWILPVMAVLMGLLGAAYSKALLGVKNAEAHRPLLPDPWRILPPLAAAWALAFAYPLVLGGGDNLVLELGRSAMALARDAAGTAESGLTGSATGISGMAAMTLGTLLTLCGIKIAFSLFSYTGNVPGGILMPMLCIGALLGALIGHGLNAMGLLDPAATGSCVLFGMMGFFSAMVRAPLTGIALVLEMSGALTCLPGGLIVGLGASLTATRLGQPPVYDLLRAAIAVPPRRR